MTDRASSSATSAAPAGLLPRLVRLQRTDPPRDWSWLGSEARASLGTVIPLTGGEQMPAILARADVRAWAVEVAGQWQGVYLCADNVQHRVTRVAWAALPGAAGLALLERSFAQLTDQLLSGGSEKVTVQLLASACRRLWPLLRRNTRFFLEGRLRQQWQPGLQRYEDLFILSALAQADMRPQRGSLWLSEHARASGQRFFGRWAALPPSAPLAESTARGSTLIDTPPYQLRTLGTKDVNDRLVEFLNAPELAASMNLPRFRFTLASARALLASFDRHLHQFIGIFRQETAELIGFYTVSVNEAARHAHLALGIHPAQAAASHTMVDTITPLTDSYFQRFAIEKITGNVLVSNRRMLLTLAHNYTFLLEAVLRQECVVGNNRQDVVVFSTFRDRSLRPQRGSFSPGRAQE
ncbi:GNAT family protein [Comamonas sp.]|uniref:GNAT family protein n=1 Tax=Comamonas sp. TaxID=34028 RepID=UPI002898B63D|nr:GNAT family protein [Comamonas sp.]